jgi:predicted amidophosphoribosyltransferase
MAIETTEILQVFLGTKCAGCQGQKRRHTGFCKRCYSQLPPALRKALWQRFSAGFEHAYVACLAWFREHPFQGEHRARQAELF